MCVYVCLYIYLKIYIFTKIFSKKLEFFNLSSYLCKIGDTPKALLNSGVEQRRQVRKDLYVGLFMFLRQHVEAWPAPASVPCFPELRYLS